MISRSGVVILITNCYIRVHFTLLFTHVISACIGGFGELGESAVLCPTLTIVDVDVDDALPASAASVNRTSVDAAGPQREYYTLTIMS